MTGRLYRVSISSPSDVRPERAIAERVVAELAREFTYHCDIAAVLWKREPLLANRHFQDFGNIPLPGSTDIRVAVLWSRLGLNVKAARKTEPGIGTGRTGAILKDIPA
jgi:hypothetical protein